MKLVRALLVLMLTVFFAAPYASADEDELRAEINALKSRLADLESRLSSAPAAAVAPGGVPTISVPSMVQGIEVSGFVDTTLTHNFNNPTTLNPGNRAHVFDRHADAFNVNAAELVFKKVATPDSRVGFRTDLYFGNDAEVIGSAGLGTTDDEFDLEQAYAEVLVPMDRWGWNDLDVKLGKFVTPFGVEVIESKDNWNTSRGFLFGYAIPFTHTGAWASTNYNAWGQASHAAVGLVNGWDTVDDANDDKTGIVQWGLDNIALPSDQTLSLNVNYAIGPEVADYNNRNLLDVILTYKPSWKKWTFMYNYDYGHEENLLNSNIDDANWWGNAFYGRYDINEKWSFSGRWEYFADNDGVRVIAGNPARYWEMTGTLEYRPWANLITRMELRYDDANQDVFFDGGTFNDSQTMLLGEVIYAF